jgi:cation diffusion facilitator CzcD-associated flavoprotein CzcO
VSSHGTVESEVLINAGGILNNLQMPDIPGLDTFPGPQLHTAAWDDRVDLTGKRVAIIGAGASAVQVVPEVRKIAKHVDVYIRTPSWISPPVALPAGVEKGHIYSEEEKKAFRVDGKGYRSMRKGLEDQFNSMFGAFTKGSVEQQDLRGRFEGRMKALIKDEALQKNLIPSFEAGCRRINPGEEYLIALQEENVRPVFERIERIDSDGVVLGNGVKHEADVLIAATGFNTSFRPRFPILGTGGVNLQDLWEDDPTSYCGIAVSGFPNYLMFLGPNTPISNGSLMGVSQLYFLVNAYTNINRPPRSNKRLHHTPPPQNHPPTRQIIRHPRRRPGRFQQTHASRDAKHGLDRNLSQLVQEQQERENHGPVARELAALHADAG